MFVKDRFWKSVQEDGLYFRKVSTHFSVLERNFFILNDLCETKLGFIYDRSIFSFWISGENIVRLYNQFSFIRLC